MNSDLKVKKLQRKNLFIFIYIAPLAFALLMPTVSFAEDPCRGAFSSESIAESMDPTSQVSLHRLERVLKLQAAIKKAENSRKRKAFKRRAKHKKQAEKAEDPDALAQKVEQERERQVTESLNRTIQDFSPKNVGDLTFSLKTITMGNKTSIDAEGERIATADQPGTRFLPVRIVVKDFSIEGKSPDGKIIGLQKTSIDKHVVDADRLFDLEIQSREIDQHIELDIILDGEILWSGSFEPATRQFTETNE